MKALRMMTLLTSAAAFLIWGQISSGEAATSLGEFCWQTPGGTTKLAVTDMGGGHFLLNGRSTHPDGTVTAEYGSAEVVGASVIISGTGTRETATEIRATTSRGVLDLATLNGTYERLRIIHTKSDPNPSSAFVVRPDPEMATFIPCP
jgi:uncharacterized protein with beta-barrel porin domain